MGGQMKAGLEALPDVSGVELDLSIPRKLRAGYMEKAAGDLYCFRVGELGVELAFMDRGPALQEALVALLRRKRSGL